MARLSPLSPDNPELKENFGHFIKLLGYVPNNILILSRKPMLVKGMAALASAVWADPSNEVDNGLKRLVAFMAGKTHGSKYSMAHSAEAAHRSGISEKKFDALDDYQTSPLFTEAERVALDFTVASASQPNAVTDALFEKMTKYWTESQIVEIAAVVGINGFLNRWNDTMQPPLEPEPTEFAKKHLVRYFK
jgi:alkylhydroperoxidase family enzyme